MSALRQTGWHENLIGVSSAMRSWLQNAGSLTHRITQRCADFAVREIYERNAHPMVDEAQVVGVNARQYALLRDVYLYCGNTPMVFAHSVLPFSSLVGRWGQLKQLGNRPLGAALFVDPIIRRQRLQFKKIDQRHPLYPREWVKNHQTAPDLWARRSLFSLTTQRILVTEVFLPDILTL